MANYDAGHYFLTVMAPLDRDGYVEIGGERRSVVNHVREILLTLPTSQQDYVSEQSHLMSPFARVPGTHFAHIFIVDDVHYNGRRPSNPVLDLLKNVNLTIPERVDHLPDAYLVMALDFDAPDGSDASLRAYTDALWDQIGPEIVMIFRHAEGFEGVGNAESFFAFVKAGQVETSLPFNDYWAYAPRLRSPWPLMVAGTIAVLVLAAMAATTGLATGWTLALLSLLAVVAVNVAIVGKLGLTPFPKAPGSDLGSVLKALYIQQKFTALAIENQGADSDKLLRAFDAFCETHRPADVTGPRQPAGVLRSRRSTP